MVRKKAEQKLSFSSGICVKMVCDEPAPRGLWENDSVAGLEVVGRSLVFIKFLCTECCRNFKVEY